MKIIMSLLLLIMSMQGYADLISLDDSAFGVGSITRDTDTGLDWLDVTATRDLSYDDVAAQMSVGGSYEGWRYATVTEFDTLIKNFGYIPIESECRREEITFCDSGLVGDNHLIEQMLKMLGDNNDVDDDVNNSLRDTDDNGAGTSYFILIDDLNEWHDHFLSVGLIADGEYIYRDTGQFYNDFGDFVESSSGPIGSSSHGSYYGSALVRVPEPSTFTLLALGLLGLVLRRKKAV